MSDQAGHTALRVDGLAAGYGDLMVVEGISLELAAGQFLGITGRNGAGKSTSVQAIAGLVRARGGRIRLGDDDVTGWRPHRRARAGLALVPEGKRVVGSMTVADNLRLGAFAAPSAPVRSEAERQEHLLTLFPALSERLAEPAGRLSGGQQQMLAIAQGLMSEPRVLLVDEPSSGLAPMVVDDVLAALRSFADDGVAVVVVEQQVDGIARYADSIAVLEAGRIAWAGPAATPSLLEIVRDIVFGDAHAFRPEHPEDAETAPVSGP